MSSTDAPRAAPRGRRRRRRAPASAAARTSLFAHGEPMDLAHRRRAGARLLMIVGLLALVALRRGCRPSGPAASSQVETVDGRSRPGRGHARGDATGPSRAPSTSCRRTRRAAARTLDRGGGRRSRVRRLLRTGNFELTGDALPLGQRLRDRRRGADREWALVVERLDVGPLLRRARGVPGRRRGRSRREPGAVWELYQRAPRRRCASAGDERRELEKHDIGARQRAQRGGPARAREAASSSTARTRRSTRGRRRALRRRSSEATDARVRSASARRSQALDRERPGYQLVLADAPTASEKALRAGGDRARLSGQPARLWSTRSGVYLSPLVGVPDRRAARGQQRGRRLPGDLRHGRHDAAHVRRWSCPSACWPRSTCASTPRQGRSSARCASPSTTWPACRASSSASSAWASSATSSAARIDELFFAARLPNPTFGKGGLLWASLTLALLTLPVVIVRDRGGAGGRARARCARAPTPAARASGRRSGASSCRAPCRAS